MNEQDAQKITDKKLEIESQPDFELQDLPFDLLERATNKTTKLLANSGSTQPIGGRHRWYAYKFREPVFLTELQITTSNYSGYAEFEIIWCSVDGQKYTSKSRIVGDLVSIPINNLCSEISFRPPQTYFTSPAINEVRLVGAKKEDLGSILKTIGELSSTKDEAISTIDAAVVAAERKIQAGQKAVEERASVQREITQSKASLARLKKNIDDINQKRLELIAEQTTVSSSLEEALTRLKNAQNDERNLTESKGTLQSEIAAYEIELKKLKTNINIFPSEIVEFVNQCSENIKYYRYFAAIPILIIFIMFVLLISGAADLTVIISENPKIDIQTLLLSRIPYVTIASGIIYACYEIAKVFISEMIKINRQRLNLTKISIIAKDVSSAAETGLNNLDEDKIYKLRTEQKMELLRNHLTYYLGKDVQEPLPKTLLNPFPSIFSSPSISDQKTE